MKQIVCFLLLIPLIHGLSGCSTPPEPPPALPPTMAETFHERSAEILASGGLSAVGIAKSKSLYIALNRAKVNGRLGLADLLEARLENLQKEGSKEDVQSILSDHIQGLVAKELRYETADDGTVTAYALMELSSKILNQKTKLGEAALRN